jgi:hypothetical protein
MGRFKTIISGWLFLSLAFTALLTQYRLKAVREENLSLRRQSEELLLVREEVRNLSNELVRVSMSEQPNRELLRLRGEVTVLRRSIAEIQKPTPVEREPDGDCLVSKETLPRFEQLLISSEAEYERARALADSLRESSTTEDTLLQAVFASGVEDKFLNALLEQRAIYEQGLANFQSDSFAQSLFQDAGNQLAMLNEKITERLKGITAGILARADSLNQGITDLKAELDKVRRQSAGILEH